MPRVMPKPKIHREAYEPRVVHVDRANRIVALDAEVASVLTEEVH